MRVRIRVRPGAARTWVGGSYGDGALVVAVSAPAVDGRATEAALLAVAAAFEVRPRAVRLVSGPTSRDKIIEIEGDPAALADRLAALLLADPGP
ncbi:MAG: DUF167 domain-containing protein [Sporichthyaceae bacterium]|nr:DUF167 domain-containing protein [Sporichthyaceae bacterium]